MELNTYLRQGILENQVVVVIKQIKDVHSFRGLF